MKTITTMMMKGGSGKTTLTRILATAALDKGLRVHVVDMDTDFQVKGWRARFEKAPWGRVAKPDWPQDRLTIGGAAPSIQALYEELDRLEAEGCDLVLLDTRPGAHADTEDLVLAADLALIPTRPEQSDFELAKRTAGWFLDIVATLEDPADAPALRTVLTAVPAKMISVLLGEVGIETLTPRDREVLTAITELPHAQTVIPFSKYWNEIGAWGPLGLAAEAAAREPQGRLQARIMREQMEGANALLDELFGVIDAKGQGHGQAQTTVPDRDRASERV